MTSELWALLLLAAALLLLAAPVAASELQDHFYESEESSFSGSVPSASHASHTETLSSLYLRFNNVALYQHPTEILISGSSNALFEVPTGYYSAKIGSIEIGSTYVQSTGTSLSIYPEDWNIPSNLSGAQTVEIATGHSYTGVEDQKYYSDGSHLGHGFYNTLFNSDGVYLIDPSVSSRYWKYGGDEYPYYFYEPFTESNVQLSMGLSYHAEGYTSWETDIYRDSTAYGFQFSVIRHGFTELVDIFQSVSDNYDFQIYSGTESTDISYIASNLPVRIRVTSPSSDFTYTSIYGEPLTPSAEFTLSLSPPTAAVGDPVQATLTADADAPRYSEIAWTVTDPDGNSDIELYTKSSPAYTNWTHYNKTSRFFEASTEIDAHNLNFTPTGPGTWTVRAVVRDNEPPSTGAAVGDVSATCEVSRKAGNVDVVISTFDGARTSATYLSGVALTVWDLSRNASVIYDSSGTYILGSSGTYNGLVTISVPLGDEIQIAIEKSGYISQNFTRFVQPTALPLNQMPISVTLMPAITPAPDQVYMGFRVQTAVGVAISGAAVVAGSHAGITDDLGYCRVVIPYNETVSFSVSADGYASVSGYLLPVTSNSETTVTLYSAITPATTVPGGSTVTTDTRSIDEKADSALGILFDNIEVYAGLASLILLMAMISWLGPKRGRR